MSSFAAGSLPLRRATDPVRSGYNGAPPASELVTDDGLTWLEYRKTLVPNYLRAWRDLLVCYAMLTGGFALHVLATRRWGNPVGFWTAPIAILWVGFWMHSLNQFAHEGAHGHLARNRRVNDTISDWLLWPLFAQSIHSYRKSHMQHHVHLGDHHDTEISYHQCMDPWYFVRFMSGIQLGMLILRYVLKSDAGPAASKQTTRTSLTGATNLQKAAALLRTAALHGTVVLIPALFGFYASAVVWLVAVAVVYPCLNTSRNLLEHRAYDATCSMDFATLEHGAVNRHFGNDLFSRYFGAAGVNKHLLHHWDPTVSYTRFTDMEAFLLRTPFAHQVEEGRTTYFRAARAILASSRRVGA